MPSFYGYSGVCVRLLYNMSKLVFVDTETTGLDRYKERLLEVACVQVHDRAKTGVLLHQYINPEQEVGEGAFRVHGISWEKVKHEPVFAEVADQIIAMLKHRYGIRTIGLFLDGESNGRTIKQRTLEQYLGWKYHNQEEFVRVRAEIRKTGVGSVSVPSFDEYYLVPVGKIQDTAEELEIDGDWTAGKIKNAFSKHQTQRFGNKVLVNRMMDVIA